MHATAIQDHGKTKTKQENIKNLTHTFSLSLSVSLSLSAQQKFLEDLIYSSGF
jgi:hypothetical protein